MGFADNAVSFPDALPRYVEAFGDRFEDGYTGACDRYDVAARLAVGRGLTVFYAHVPDRDEHLLLPLGDEESDPTERRRLESVRRGFAGPKAAEVAGALQTHLETAYDRVRTVDGCACFLRCPYAPALGGQPTMILQAYANPESASLSVGPTSRHADDADELAACIAKQVPKATVEDYVDRLVSRVDAAVRDDLIDRNVIETVERPTLEARGFRRQTTKPVPQALHPEHGGCDADLWQVPASTADWVPGSNGFVRLWRLPDGTGLVDPVGVDGSDADAVDATASRLDAAPEVPAE
jgi:hypothetical protein